MATPAATPVSNLVEVADPPVSNRTSPVREMSMQEKLKVVATLMGAGLALAAVGWWLFQNGSPIRGGLLLLFGAFCIIAAVTPKALVAACPYCGNSIDTISRKNRGEGEQIRCEKCSEY